MRKRTAITILPAALLLACSGAPTKDVHTTSAALSAPSAGSPVLTSRACSLPAGSGYAACTALVVTSPEGAVVADTTPGGYGPTDLSSAYSIPKSNSSATIAIVDAYDDPNAETDLATYRAQFGLPPCTTANGCFTKVGEAGTATLPAPDSSWAVEIALDVQMASAACPTCKILLVEATSASLADLGASVNTAVSMGASVVSNSYGGGEFSGETSYDADYNHPGVAIFASSGDSGYGVSYPAASPFVTARRRDVAPTRRDHTPRVDGVSVERRRLGLQPVRGQACLAARHRLRQPDRRRRVRGGRPGHAGGGL
jgi:hypothetical protein